MSIPGFEFVRNNARLFVNSDDADSGWIVVVFSLGVIRNGRILCGKTANAAGKRLGIYATITGVGT